MIAFLINTAIAVIWLMLRKAPSIGDFLLGYFLGFLLIAPFKTLLKGERYVRRVIGFVRFCLLFLMEFIKSNLIVAYIVLFVPKDRLAPSFFNFRTENLTKFETVLLSYCVTLTPGTISVNIDRTKKKLVVHCLDYRGPKKTRKELNEKFVKTILRFTR